MNAVLWLAIAAAACGVGVFAFLIRRANRPAIGGEVAMANAVAAFLLAGACEAVAVILLVVGLIVKLV